MSEFMIEFLQSHNIAPELIVFIISMMPVFELRLGLVAASILKIPFTIAFPICVIGNIIPVPFILLFIKKIFAFMRKHGILSGLVDWLEDKAMGKSTDIQNRQLIGLLAFVAIPLPGTGAWTGSLIASLLNLDTKKSFFTISGGVVIAGIIMLVISYFVPSLFGF